MRTQVLGLYAAARGRGGVYIPHRPVVPSSLLLFPTKHNSGRREGDGGGGGENRKRVISITSGIEPSAGGPRLSAVAVNPTSYFPAGMNTGCIYLHFTI